MQPPWSSWLHACGTNLGTIKHESGEWDPHGKIEGIDFCCPEGGKLILHHCCHLCTQECWRPWCDENLYGFILYVWPREKNVFGKRILKSLVRSFCFICKSQRENCWSAYIVFRSCRGLMMLHRGRMKPRCCFLCCVNFFCRVQIIQESANAWRKGCFPPG